MIGESSSSSRSKRTSITAVEVEAALAAVTCRRLRVDRDWKLEIEIEDDLPAGRASLRREAWSSQLALVASALASSIDSVVEQALPREGAAKQDAMEEDEPEEGGTGGAEAAGETTGMISASITNDRLERCALRTARMTSGYLA